MAIKKISFTDRTDWLELRKQAIGGSDAAAIVGLSKWSSPLSVYADKLGLVPEREDNEAMRQGRDLEAYVAERFAEQTGYSVRRENHILVNEEFPFMHANIDRRITGYDIGLECKTTSVYNRTDFEGGDVPPEYYTQCQHYMAVTGWSTWYLAVLVLNKGFYVFKVDRNDDDIAALIEAERSFWYDHVIPGVPPEPMEQDDDLMSTLYPSDEGGYVPLHSVSRQLKDLMYKKQKAKDLDGEITALENQIKMALGDASEGSDDHFKVTWKTRTSNRLDTTRLKKEQPEIYEAFTKESSYRTFIVKEAKQANKEAIA
jgi:putative phage-type endonuclease